MTNEEARALYDRAAAAGFRLEPGCRVRMLWGDDFDAAETIMWSHGGSVGVSHEVLAVRRFDADGLWCDFRESPSLGCLLGQVRAAWGDPSACTMSHTVSGVVEWLIWMPGHDRAATPDESRPTEAEALVAALEAAPKVHP